jgi:hypothetical protein
MVDTTMQPYRCTIPCLVRTTAHTVFSTTTALVTIGDGAIKLGKAGSATTVDGSLAVGQAATMTGQLTATSGNIPAELPRATNLRWDALGGMGGSTP